MKSKSKSVPATLEQVELHYQQLAAISTGARQNTRGTAMDRIKRDHPYWTQAYQDVCTAIDREMTIREQVEDLRKENTELARQNAAMFKDVVGHNGPPTLNSAYHDVNQRMGAIRATAGDMIQNLKMLRRRNELLEAQIRIVEIFEAASRGQRPDEGGAMCVDSAWEMERILRVEQS